MKPCLECGFEYRLDEAQSAGTAIMNGAVELASLVSDDRAEVLARREPQTWSPLEYACHVRDVLIVQRERVLMARRQERPSFDPMGRDERVDHDGYSRQRPADVARQLADAALLFENVLSRLGNADWERTVMYNYLKLSERSLRWVAMHTLHEVSHHLGDVRRQMP
jgi:hypothetical protein